MCLGDGGESLRSWYFYVVVPQPSGFCILNKLANCIALFIFPALNRPLPGETQFYFFSSCTAIMLKWKADKKGPSASSRKNQKLIQLLIQPLGRNILTNIYILVL